MTTNLTTMFGLFTDGVTDNHAKYVDIRAWAALQPQPPYLDLLLAAGSYACTAYASFIDDGTTPAITRATIEATGATMLQAWVGGSSQFSDNLHSARVSTAVVRQTSVRLITPADAAIFSTGRWVLLAAVDMQGFGYPLNSPIFDFLQIQSIVGSTISFTAPITNTYLSTYPVFNAGDASNPDLGGPATLYLLPANWDLDITWNNLSAGDAAGPLTQLYGPGRKMTFNNCTFYSRGYVPTVSKEVYFVGGSNGESNIEFDKMVELFSATGTAFAGVYFQSSSIKNAVFINCAITGDFNGVPRSATVEWCSIGGTLRVGATSYGYSDSLTVRHCSVGALGYNAAAEAVTDFSWVGSGVIKCLKSVSPNRLTTPGAQFWFSGSREWGVPFRVTNVTDAGTYIYIETTLTAWPVFTLPDFPGTVLLFRHVEALRLTFENNTSSDLDILALNNAPNGRALYEYNERLYTSLSWSPASDRSCKAWGNISSIVVDVRTPYTGVSGTAHVTLDFFYTDSSLTEGRKNTAAIDVRTAGIRTFTPTLITGSTGADSLGSAFGVLWCINDVALVADFNSTAEGAGVQPTVFLQVTTDQGLTRQSSSGQEQRYAAFSMPQHSLSQGVNRMVRY